jgi:hypothetical protein
VQAEPAQHPWISFGWRSARWLCAARRDGGALGDLIFIFFYFLLARPVSAPSNAPAI